jgi:hypothetical protein
VAEKLPGSVLLARSYRCFGTGARGRGTGIPLWYLIIRNGAGAIGAHLHDAASELIGSVCLSLFLTWTMMTLHLGLGRY